LTESRKRNAPESPSKTVEIYTDGGCNPNPGFGGWAAVLLYGDQIREISGGAPESTNNRMELTAAIEALRALKHPCRVLLHTDSEYVQKGISQWLPRWKQQGWQRRGAAAVKNLDLWQTLDRLSAEHEIQWKWVRGHAGNRYNERCDELANEAIRAERRAASGY